MDTAQTGQGRWYSGVTGYQWTVLIIASLGWIFDVFEGQIFVASMNEAMPSLLPKGTSEGTVSLYNNMALGSFLVGGAIGGVLFGMLSDRIGRTKTMVITILVYSGFTCVTAFSQTWWQMVILRFLVAMGIGGEWAVAGAMVAEVFPSRARAWSLGIFHASSVFGVVLAVLAGIYIVGNPAFGWRWGFAVGALPALLTLWIRWRLREPESWVQARDRAREDKSQRTGRLGELFGRELRRRTLVGVALATVGLATFWGVHIYGKDIMRGAAERGVLAEAAEGKSDAEVLKENFSDIKRMEMIGMLLVTLGGGAGLVLFGPLSDRIGRRGAFLVFHLGGLAAGIVLFSLFSGASVPVLWVALPVFGFLTVGMHAGYAIYFPELFPTRLRGTGGGFCFNAARFLAAPILLVHGWMRQDLGLTLEGASIALSLLFLLGVALLLFAPETRGRELPT